jgi:hypothetical protein
VCVTGSAVFLLQLPRLRALVRPLYVRIGILPEIPSGVYPALAPPDARSEPAVTESADPG